MLREAHREDAPLIVAMPADDALGLWIPDSCFARPGMTKTSYRRALKNSRSNSAASRSPMPP